MLFESRLLLYCVLEIGMKVVIVRYKFIINLCERLLYVLVLLLD